MKTNIQRVIKTWSIKRYINQHDKHKYDHYVNPHAIRTMICIIAKQMGEHKGLIHMNMGDLKKLYMHVKGLIIMAFNILIKTWSIKTKNHKHPYDHYVYALDLEHTY